jgi:glycosyltransferase involved in cell wall biosynthesis
LHPESLMAPTPFTQSRLLLFNLVTDADHPILGFTTQWIRELAARVHSIDVITMQAGRVDVPDNVHVHSAGREHGYSEPRRIARFYRLLFRILREKPVAGCFSHMMPEFSLLAGPVLRARRIPLVTWYAHPRLHWRVKLAHLFSNQMVASLPNAYPYRKDKFTVIGQGIDTTLFSPNGRHPEPDRILCVGRISPAKNHETLLRAVARLQRPSRLTILGAATGNTDERQIEKLRQLTDDLGIGSRVTFAPPVPPPQLPAWYRSCAVHVNLTPAGFGDKVAWEAMACGRPCVVANSDFGETLGDYRDELLFEVNDPIDLATKLDRLLASSETERATIGRYLRAQVQSQHSLPRLADRVIEQLSRFSRDTT